MNSIPLRDDISISAKSVVEVNTCLNRGANVIENVCAHQPNILQIQTDGGEDKGLICYKRLRLGFFTDSWKTSERQGKY
jgi:hypothetical protein